jgi:hypothetical protein
LNFSRYIFLVFLFACQRPETLRLLVRRFRLTGQNRPGTVGAARHPLMS